MDLNPQQIREMADEVNRLSLAAFFEDAFREIIQAEEYQPNWHIDCMAEHLQAVYTGEIKRLIINIMPRSLKSALTSAAFPAWVMGKDPSTEIIGVSYVRDLSTRNAQWCKLIMQSDWYQRQFPQTQIMRGEDTKTKFSLTRRGGLRTTAVNANVTGFGGNLIIIDDPINPAEALSDTVRIGTNTWIDTVLMSRLNNMKNDKVVCIMQRVHEDDVTGHLLEKGGWHHLSLPAYALRPIIIDFGNFHKQMDEGEYLQESRFGKDEVDKTINDIGDYAFAGQYMQSPVPMESGEINIADVQYYDPVDENFDYGSMNAYILCDPANEKKKTSDYTAFIVVGLAPDNNFYVLDMIMDRLDPTERVDTLFQLHRKWNKTFGKPPMVGYEKYGMMTDTHYLKERQKQENYRFSLIELGGNKMSKEARIRSFIPNIRQRRLYLPVNLMYTDKRGFSRDLVEELVQSQMRTFPVSKYDDMLDALARINDDDLSASFPMRRVRPSISVESMGMKEQDNSESWMNW